MSLHTGIRQSLICRVRVVGHTSNNTFVVCQVWAHDKVLTAVGSGDGRPPFAESPEFADSDTRQIGGLPCALG
jgi:hypothetical protein